MKIYNFEELLFDGSKPEFLIWFNKIEDCTLEYTFIKNNTTEKYKYFELYELNCVYNESFTMYKTKLIYSEYEQQHYPFVSEMREKIREYKNNGLRIYYNIDRLGLLDAFVVLLKIENPEMYDKEPYKDYHIEENEDYLKKKKKKLSKKNYLLSKNK
jgi:hypothetical protein